MSEDYKNNSEEAYSSTSEWDSIVEDLNWLEEQAKKGDEATREKAQKYIKQNIARMNAILETLSEEDTPEGAIEAQKTFEDDQKAQSKPYERTVAGPDGTITTISADTQEELQEKLEELRIANKEQFSRY